MKIIPLELKYTHEGTEISLFPSLLQNEDHSILVDCGYEGFLPLIEQAVLKKGFDFDNITSIIVTHDDIDHIGGLKELIIKYPYIQIYSSEIEEPYISGTTKSLRLQQAENLFHSLPDNEKQGALLLQERLSTIKRMPVNYVFSQDEKPEFWEGLSIINTPGHTTGHISLYFEESKTLIAGDALVITKGKLDLANIRYTLDLEEAVRSVKKLNSFPIETIICYHGGVMTGNINHELDKLLQKL